MVQKKTFYRFKRGEYRISKYSAEEAENQPTLF